MRFSMRSVRGVTSAAACCLGLFASAAAHGQVVISQIWSGGGSGASGGPAADVVELYNAGGSAQNLGGWAIQYASRTGTTWTSASLSGSVPAKGYFLIKLTNDSLAGGQLMDGVANPTPNISFSASADSAGITSSGKIALTSSTTVLAGSCPSGGAIVDFVGYSFSTSLAPSCFEGFSSPVGWAPGSDVASTPSKSIQRKCRGTQDSNDNFQDFEQTPIQFRNASSPVFNGVAVSLVSGPTSAAPGDFVSFIVGGTDCNAFPVSNSATGTADLSSIGGSAGAPMTNLNDGSGTFTVSATVAPATTTGVKSLTFTINNGGPTGALSQSFTVTVVNDECSGALIVPGTGPWTRSWNNAGGTTGSYAQDFVGCDLGSSLPQGAIAKDVWFRWTAPASGQYTVTTAGTTPSSHDSRLAVYDNACPPAAPLACNDNFNGTRSTLSFTAAAGQQYLIQVGSAPGSFTTTGVLTIISGDSGACCPANFGTCVIVASSPDCINAGGTFRGAGSTCASANCPAPTGRCCNTAGGCTVISEGECNVAFIPRLSWTVGLTCEPEPACPAGGRCCLPTGACTNVVESLCTGPGAIWNPGPEVCATLACPQPAACCLPNGGCIGPILPAECEAAPNFGFSRFGFTDCALVTPPCPSPVACCLPDGSCIGPILPVTCADAPNFGAAQPGITACTPSPCAALLPFCCRGTTCTLSDPLFNPCDGIVDGSTSTPIAECGNGTSIATCCFADFSHTNGVTIDDLFLYFNAYFNSSPWANIGGDGISGPTIDDLFLYINAYFNGCQP